MLTVGVTPDTIELLPVSTPKLIESGIHTI
jgi:hypothetical protein